MRASAGAGGQRAEQRIDTPSTSSSQDRPLAGGQVVVFDLGGESYAVPIHHVREVIRYCTPRRVSRDPHALGVISVREQLVPVVDVAAILGREVTLSHDSRVIVVDIREWTSIGLLVDGVHEVIILNAEDIEPVPGGEHELLASIARLGDRLIMLIDPTRLWTDDRSASATA